MDRPRSRDRERAAEDAMASKTLNTQHLSPSLGEPTDCYVGMTGADAFHELMREQGVEVIFGYPGGAILPVFDAIHESPHFRFVLTRDEQGAGHMAEGYARASGKPGVMLVTSGPGATNSVTPMQDALMDGTPLVVFTGQVPTAAIGTDAFQEADVTGITRPCTKWNVLVKDPHEIPRRVREAFHIATSGRPGPVLVDLPKNVTSARIQNPLHDQPALPGYHPREAGTSSEVQRAAELINRAKQPVLYVGQGVLLAGASEVLRQCAEKAQIPCTTTLQGLGAFDEHSPLSLHMLGMHGSAYANRAMHEADCIIAVGARFDDRVTGDPTRFAPAAREAERRGTGGIIHFDIAPEQINKTVHSTLAVEGDARRNLEHLLPLLEPADRSPWLERIAQWKRAQPFTYREDPRDGHMKPQAVIAELNHQTQSRAVLTTGVGQHQMWAAQFYDFREPGQWITSGGLGTMGYGVPASIGARLGWPDRPVINIDGDGSFCMTCMEMCTAAQHGIQAKTIVLNNDFQGMVKQWQDLFYERRSSHSEMHNPDFVKLIEALHCYADRCVRSAELADKMERFLAHDGPAVLECLVEKHEHVYPMVPAGQSVDEMVLDPANDEA
jgi:acetolactate synthase-1/2/3 large subunit